MIWRLQMLLGKVWQEFFSFATDAVGKWWWIFRGWRKKKRENSIKLLEPNFRWNFLSDADKQKLESTRAQYLKINTVFVLDK